MRKFVAFALIAFLHLALTLLSIAYSFGKGMERFDNLAPASTSEIVVSGAAAILTFPGIQLYRVIPLSVRSGFIGSALEWGLLFANSLVWACAITWVAARLMRKTTHIG